MKPFSAFVNSHSSYLMEGHPEASATITLCAGLIHYLMNYQFLISIMYLYIQ